MCTFVPFTESSYFKLSYAVCSQQLNKTYTIHELFYCSRPCRTIDIPVYRFEFLYSKGAENLFCKQKQTFAIDIRPPTCHRNDSRSPFLEGPERFWHPESHAKSQTLSLSSGHIKNIILNMTRSSLHTRRLRRIHLSVLRCRLPKNGFAGAKSFRTFRETGRKHPISETTFGDISFEEASHPSESKSIRLEIKCLKFICVPEQKRRHCGHIETKS